MDGEHYVIAPTISWLLKAVYECRFHWQVGVLRGRLLSQVAPRHLRWQRSLAWLIGGEWYRGVFARQLDRAQLHMDGLYFEILVNSIGITALPRPEQPEERGFQRKLAEGHMRVTIIPRPDQPESHEQVRVIDSGFRGLRVKATAALETLQRGDRVLVKSGRDSYECELAWHRNGQAGLVVLRAVAPPTGT